ncbi:MAG: S8 family serine peptidase [Cyanobacteria bacterium P01_G01_bin.19]
MSNQTKISPAFEPFLAESDTEGKRDAIVIYKTPPLEGMPLRGRLRELSRRLDAVKQQAAERREIENRVFKTYQENTRDLGYADEPLSTTPIASNTLPVAKVEVTRETLTALASQDEVVAILPNQKIKLIEPKKIDYNELYSNEKTTGYTWGLEQLEIPQMWEKTKGRDINVAVLDTGVYGDHPALANRVKEFVIIDPLGRRISTNRSFDAGQHGTHVCGTVAGGKTETGVSIGVAPEANLLVAGVLIGDATLKTLFEGMAWAIEQGADIINMSLGLTYYEPLFAEFLEILVNQYGILPVVAICNENHGNTSSPGNVYNAFSVGAVEQSSISTNGLDVAFFSSGASLTFPGTNNALIHKPDIVAPGAQIYSCIPPEQRANGITQYTYMDGTSMATPHVAGVAALLMAAQPTAPVEDIIKVLKETAIHPQGKEFCPDNRWGYGLIQPVAALQALTS